MMKGEVACCLGMKGRGKGTVNECDLPRSVRLESVNGFTSPR